MPIIGSSASQSGRTPGVATITGVTAGNAQVTVDFTEPAYKGKGNVTYTATSSPGGFTGTASSSPIVVTGLSNGTSYTFTLTTNSAAGVLSAASSASSSVTPILPRAIYVGGGRNASNNPTTSIEKIITPADTISTLASTMSFNVVLETGSHANSGTAGYWGAGLNSSYVSQSGYTKITFSTDVTSGLSANISTARSGGSGFANSGTAGYLNGGSDSVGDQATGYIQDVEKLTYSNETSSGLGNKLNVPRFIASAFANSGTAGYVAGGYGNARLNSINKNVFSTDTYSTLSATLSVAQWFANGGFANSGTAGYAPPGENSGGRTSVINRIAFSNDTRSTIAYVSRSSQAGGAISGTAGYLSSGYNSGGSVISEVDKLSFSNDTYATLGTGLSTGRFNSSGHANSGTL